MAALPDFMAKADMLAITSGRASKMMSRTPMGQVMRSSSRLSSRRVRKVTLFTVCAARPRGILASQCSRGSVWGTVQAIEIKHCDTWILQGDAVSSASLG